VSPAHAEQTEGMFSPETPAKAIASSHIIISTSRPHRAHHLTFRRPTLLMTRNSCLSTVISVMRVVVLVFVFNLPFA